MVYREACNENRWILIYKLTHPKPFPTPPKAYTAFVYPIYLFKELLHLDNWIFTSIKDSQDRYCSLNFKSNNTNYKYYFSSLLFNMYLVSATLRTWMSILWPLSELLRFSVNHFSSKEQNLQTKWKQIIFQRTTMTST